MLSNQTFQKVANSAKGIVVDKLTTSIDAILGLSRFSKSECLDDMGYSSCVLLGLIHALATCDVLLCAVLLELAATHRPLHSSHFVPWLLEDFQLDEVLLKRASERVQWLRRSSVLAVPEHIASLVTELAVRSRVTSSEPLGEVESKDLVSSPPSTQETEMTTQIEHEDNTTVLLKAVAANNSKAVEELAAKGADMTLLVEGQSLLHIAAKAGAIDSAKSLIKFGARLNRRDKQRFTPLHRAVEADNERMVQFLIEAGADAGCKLAGGKTLLMHALSGNCLSAAATLLNLGSDANERNDNGETALITILNTCRDKLQSAGGKLDKTTSENTCEAIMLLVKHGADINAAYFKGQTALHISAMLCDDSITDTLCRLGSDTNIKDENGETALITTLSHCRHKLQSAGGKLNKFTSENTCKAIMLLVKHGSDINATNAEGQTALHISAMLNDVSLTETLVTLGSDVNRKDENCNTPLHLAVMNNSSTILESLLKSGANVNYQNNSGNAPLHIAARQGNMDVLEILVELKADLELQDNQGCTPLCVAVMNGHTDIVDMLRKEHVQINHKTRDGKTPLLLALEKGHTDIAQLLLEQGAEVNSRDSENNTPLHYAAREGHFSIVQTLLKSGAEINARSQWRWTPLHEAAEGGHLLTVQALLEAGAEINAGGDCQYTPLHKAAEGGHLLTVQALLEAGAEINARDGGQYTPLHTAAVGGHLLTVQALLEAGAEINARGGGQNTPLHKAAERGHLLTVQALLEAGAEINARGQWSDTPLHRAAEGGHLLTVQALVDRGAEVNTRNRNNRTPLSWAIRNNHSDVVSFLKSRNGVK